MVTEYSLFTQKDILKKGHQVRDKTGLCPMGHYAFGVKYFYAFSLFTFTSIIIQQIR